MIGNALFVTSLLFLALGLFLMQECTFLIPYRQLLWERWGEALIWFGAAFFVNLFTAVYTVWRKLFLKDTGRKLAHLEKQLRTDARLSGELWRRLQE
ncbi:MAG TPA: hypothetical protein VHI99_05485 [Vicinamibacterales bacterium]|jgi:hypothetical protein|nr:hypothetical protein [Vicinamibacterales bacterium]